MPREKSAEEQVRDFQRTVDRKAEELAALHGPLFYVRQVRESLDGLAAVCAVYMEADGNSLADSTEMLARKLEDHLRHAEWGVARHVLHLEHLGRET